MTSRIKDFLHACKYGSENVVAKFIEENVDIDAQGIGGLNGIHWACIYGQAKVIAMLIEAGININLIDNRGRNGVHFACRNGHANIIPTLVEAGIDINVQDNNGRHGFYLACRYGHVNVISKLIEAGIDINVQDNDGRNALEVTQAYSNGISSADPMGVISVLIDAGITFRSQNLNIDGVQYALDKNAAQRAAAQHAMLEADFPQRATECEDVLDFLFLRP